MKEEKLSEKEKELFKALRREKTPPPHLEDKVVNKLKENGLIRKKDTIRIIGWVSSIAASLIMFYLGTIYQQQTNTTMIEIEPTRGYMLILHEDEKFQPGEPMAMFNEYKAWMEGTFEQGVKITGQELKDNTVIVNKNGAKESSGEERTTGYFILEANSLEEAVKVAEANPHVKYGGSIEVKPYLVR